MIICHTHRFIFVRTLKPAGTSLEVALAHACGPDDVIARIVPREPALHAMPQIDFGNATIVQPRTGEKQVIRQHSALRRAITVFGGTIRDYRIITSARNPWDKLISSFYWKLHQTPAQMLEPGQAPEDLVGEAAQRAFRRFILSPIKDPCEAFDMYAQDWMPLIDHLVRFEALEEDLIGVASTLALPNTVRLSKERSKSGLRPKAQNIQVSYDDELDAAVRRRFAREIAWFGYTGPTAQAPPYVPPAELDTWKDAAFQQASKRAP
mgnify:CR=1 FL=1